MAATSCSSQGARDVGLHSSAHSAPAHRQSRWSIPRHAKLRTNRRDKSAPSACVHCNSRDPWRRGVLPPKGGVIVASALRPGLHRQRPPRRDLGRRTSRRRRGSSVARPAARCCRACLRRNRGYLRAGAGRIGLVPTRASRLGRGSRQALVAFRRASRRADDVRPTRVFRRSEGARRARGCRAVGRGRIAVLGVRLRGS